MKRVTATEKLKAALKAGQVYRRSDFSGRSKSVDRHLVALVKEGALRKLQQGLYMAPESSAFGDVPPDEGTLLRSFLKDDHFVTFSYNAFNSLGLGTTQLYDRKVVFNRKRSGEHTVGGRTYLFHRWREAPKEATPEFLVVALLNQLNQLAEDKGEVLSQLEKKLYSFDSKKLKRAATHYGTLSTQLKLEALAEQVPA